jgi:predicted nucleic acid-binding protein
MAGSGRGERWTSWCRGNAKSCCSGPDGEPEVVLLDDKLARRMARRLGVPVTGTLGVLLRANRSLRQKVGHMSRVFQAGFGHRKDDWSV